MTNQTVRGTLEVGKNWCTQSIKIHPIHSGTWALVPLDIAKEYSYGMTSLILFNKKQIWEVYYFMFADEQGWVLERSGMYLRMKDEDFEKFFGKFNIVTN